MLRVAHTGLTTLAVARRLDRRVRHHRTNPNALATSAADTKTRSV